MTQRYVEANGVSDAWLKAVATVRSLPGRKATHLVVRIENPLTESEFVRARVNELLDELELPPVETVRNTIFPSEWANRFPEPADLAEYYREQVATISRFQAQYRGTYFGRMVAFPREDDSGDQLSDVVEKLRHARQSRRQLSSRYELNIYNEKVDHKKMMGFPCMSFCSFHLGGGRLHLAAHYRSHYIIERAYGNYLGLAELLAYVADAAGFETGELLVISGHASIDHVGVSRLGRLIRDCEDHTMEGS